jgi:outer membrane protein assembly factor BamE (lipoprotein component of BamABCDE complex)
MKKQCIFGIALLAVFLCLAAGCNTKTEESVYSDPSNWLAFPSQILHQADVIYLYPTTYMPELPDAPIVSTIFDEGMRAGAAFAYRNQATVFETVANIYAPFYKQVNFAAFQGTHEELLDTQRAA